MVYESSRPPPAFHPEGEILALRGGEGGRRGVQYKEGYRAVARVEEGGEEGRGRERALW